ncbi:hypothetical protein VTK26DRAFT_3212 [Humicola hyalothermophila]
MMNNRGHLPAGQQAQGSADMGPVPPGGPGPRRGGRPQQHYPPAHHYHHHQHVGQPMYAANNYMAPYSGTHYYMPQPFQAAAMPGPGYMPYPHTAYGRSPPAMQHYVPMQQNYVRPPQHSPIVSSPYQPPLPGAAPVVPPLPHTPSSTHSHVAPLPPHMTTPVAHGVEEMVPAQAPAPGPGPVHLPQPSEPQQPELKKEPQPAPQPEPHPEVNLPKPPSEPAVTPSPTVSLSPAREPFRPPLPWLSVPDSPFPPRAARLRRRRKLLAADAEGVKLPQGQYGPVADTPSTDIVVEDKEEQRLAEDGQEKATQAALKSENKTEAVPPRSETPSTQDQDAPSTSATTPSSVQPPKPGKPATRPIARAVPAVPVIPALPKTGSKDATATANAEGSSTKNKVASESNGAQAGSPETNPHEVNGTTEAKPAEEAQPAPAPAKPKLWTGLFSKSSSTPSTSASATAAQARPNGGAAEASNAALAAGSFAKSNASSFAEALQAYRATSQDRLAFLEPRGLVNTGNMCYMNSVLQVLIFCIPFYDFLDQVSKKAAHSFNSETPLVDAMIMFMREFKVIDSAASVDQLQKRLKSEEYEQYGEPFTPEFVYDAIRKLPRFASMRRGHQQDAQEFLGFLLEGLHDECVQVMRTAPASTASTAPSSSLPSPTSSSRANDAPEGGDDWLEVGPRQRSAITRSSGYSHALSPITKIFGGQLRSELRVPGNKNSVTLEPYQPLQLDIGSPEIRNIIDALKGLTRPEVLHGDFNSPHGKDVRATKQVFIESVPPVLILHLKRFQFDAEGYGGTVKIWKKVGYPLEFEFPREVLSRQKRNSILAENSGAPKYRLIGVVYHHGKNASGGHYTVDVRRQDGREWIRIDDTVIRRVRDKDVAEGGAEDPSGADGRRDGGSGNLGAAVGNRFVGMNDEDTGDDDGWKQAAGGKKWSSVVNGATTPTNGQKTAKQLHKESIKDNKVAYLLFYQRI